MKMRIGKNVDNSILYYSLIVLFCMNFLRRGGVICFLFGVLMFIRLPLRFRLDANLVASFFLSVSIAVFSLFHFGVMESIKALNIFLMYQIGYRGYRCAGDKIRFAKYTIYAIFTGFALLLILTYFKNLLIGFDTVFRTLRDIWNDELVSVTLIGLLSSIVIAFSFYAFFCEKKKWIKITSCFCLAITFLINMQTATRTPFILFAVVYCIMIIIYVNNLNTSRALNVLTAGVLLCIIGGVLYFSNAMGVRDYVESSRIVERFFEEGLSTGRTKIILTHLKLMLDHPWGGENIYRITGENAHNFLQQCYDLYGCIAALLLIWVSTLWIRNMFKLLRIKDKSGLDFLLISMYLSILIQMCLEPVFTGYPAILWSLVLIHGMAYAYLEEKKNIQMEKKSAPC